MFIHQMRRSKVDLEALNKFDELLIGLPEKFKRIVFPTRQSLAEKIGLRISDIPPGPLPGYSTDFQTLRAELVVTESNFFTIEILQTPTSPRELRGEVDSAGGAKLVIDLDWFGADLISDEIQEMIDFVNGKFSVSLEPFFHGARRVDEMKAEGRPEPPVPTTKDVAAAEVLSDRSARNLAIAVRQAGGLLIDDLARQLPEKERPRTPEIRKALEDNEIVIPETVVICRKTGSQVIVVPASTNAKMLAGLKCPCGTAVSEEKVDTALNISDDGRRLLDSSHWFTLLLVHQLLEFGVPIASILVDQISGGDELDCIAAISGETVLFELKAKEFNLGNAYSFGAKIGIVEPDYSLVITTEHVGADAREHFARTSRQRQRQNQYLSFGSEESSESDITYIEGIENFRTGLASFLGERALQVFNSAVGDVFEEAILPVSALERLARDRYIIDEQGSTDSATSRKTRRTSSRRTARPRR